MPVNSENPVAAAERLTAGLGDVGASRAESSDWERLARVVLGRAPRRARSGASSKQAAKASSSSPPLLPAPLSSAAATASAHLEEIEQAAESAGLAGSKGKALKTLARWWTQSFGDVPSPDWSGGADHWRATLRAQKGIGHELADRVLMSVARLPVWPVSRASMRVACRHGWIDPSAEYDEWQGLFVRGLDATVERLERLSAAIDQIGKTHCGPKPDCEGCPLAPLLPNGRPIEWENDD